MITIKETGVQYPELTQNIIDWATANKKTIAWVERPLAYTKAEEPEYIDDITTAEINEGIRRVRAYLYRQVSDPLFMKYQRGEAKKDDWLEAVSKIKADWPKEEA